MRLVQIVLISALALHSQYAPRPSARNPNEALLDAIQDRNLERVRAILKTRDSNLNLELAMKNASGDPALVTMLLLSGADPMKPVIPYGRFTIGFRDYMEIQSCGSVVDEILRGAVAPVQPVDFRAREPIHAPAELSRALFAIASASCRLDDRYGQNSKKIGEDVLAILHNWPNLQWKPGPYDNAVLAILHVLQAAELEHNPTMTQKALYLTSQDLHVMAQDCTDPQVRAPRVIPIDISTFRGDRTLEKGWEFSWKKKFFEDAADVQYQPFETLSSPAHANLAPGRYLIMLRKGTRQMGPVEVQFGAGAGLREIQVPDK